MIDADGSVDHSFASMQSCGENHISLSPLNAISVCLAPLGAVAQPHGERPAAGVAGRLPVHLRVQNLLVGVRIQHLDGVAQEDGPRGCLCTRGS
eukprot:4407228-Prymnesium_polylepis.1